MHTIRLLVLLASATIACIAVRPIPSASNAADNLSLNRIAASLGLPAIVLPSGVSMSDAQVVLGRKLFFDRRLSINGTMSCAMCHVPKQAFASNDTQLSVGLHGRRLPRNAPTLLNVGWMESLFHDGRSSSLVTQAWMPFLHSDEMGNPSQEALVARIASLRDYAAPARAAYASDALNATQIALALAAFQYTLVSAESRFDRWRYGGETSALSESEQHGYRLFVGKANCSGCHRVGERAALFTDQQFHVTGAGAAAQARDSNEVFLSQGVKVSLDASTLASISESVSPDFGRYWVTHKDEDLFAFRTPSLRNVSRTAPYMHDGSILTLEAVVDFYVAGGGSVSNKSKLLRSLQLMPREKQALVDFLRALDGTESHIRAR